MWNICIFSVWVWRQVSCHWKYFNNDLELLGPRFFYVTDVHCPFCLFELKVNIIFKSTRIHLFLFLSQQYQLQIDCGDIDKS